MAQRSGDHEPSAGGEPSPGGSAAGSSESAVGSGSAAGGGPVAGAGASAGAGSDSTAGSEPDELAQAAADAAELIAQLRKLAGPDPSGVRQIVTDVLTALDRVTGGSLREQLPDEPPEPDRNPGTDPR